MCKSNNYPFYMILKLIEKIASSLKNGSISTDSFFVLQLLYIVVCRYIYITVYSYYPFPPITWQPKYADCLFSKQSAVAPSACAVANCLFCMCLCAGLIRGGGGQNIRHDKMATLPPTHTWLMKDNRYDWLSCPSDFFTTVNDIFSRQTCVSQKDAHSSIFDLVHVQFICFFRYRGTAV